MNYIIFDLEWNQPVNEKSVYNSKSIFEIIEIGAVKLDENRNIISKFSKLVKPQIYDKLNWRTQKMLMINMSDLQKGKNFPKVVSNFLKWCGDSPLFLTWGSQDLTELQHNMDYYNMKNLSDGPIAYYDVQKLYGRYIGEEDSSKSLETAINNLGIKKKVAFHRAYGDAYYTAKVFEKISLPIIESGLVFDSYHLPLNKKREIHLRQENEYSYISQGYDEKEKITGNRKILAINCPDCMYRAVRPKVRWFSSNGKVYYGAAICNIHGPIKGKLRIKKHISGLYYAEKTISYTDDEAVNEIKNKKNQLKNKAPEKEQI